MSIAFAPLLPWLAIAALAALAALVGLAGLFVRARGAAWRMLALGVLIATLLNPSLVNELRRPLKDVAVVIVDDSASQRIGKRREQTAAALRAIESEAAALRRSLELRVVRVAGKGLVGADRGTRLMAPLRRALADVPARRVAGIIMLTDGQVHDAAGQSELAALPKPLHVLLTGARQESDRRLVVVKAPTFGIVGKPMEMTIRIEDSGAADQSSAALTLRRDGGPVIRDLVPIGKNYRISFTLDHAGVTVFEIEVAARAGELTQANNRAVISVNGVRDRLRVLLVSGEPHAGERTWRNLLKSDPSVDLVHFTILRPPEKTDGTPINELSLISFPTRELFEVKLNEFDLVILDRYRRRGVLPSAYLRNIVNYVARGGALLEAVGPSFAGPFSIYRTPLGRVLPGEPTGRIIAKRFRPTLTKLGLRHPVTAGLPGSDAAGAGAWGSWFRQIEVVVKQGQVLMRGAEDRPLLILDRFGDGRVAQINSDQIWLWARGFEGGGPQAELLRRLAHWLMKEPELEENDLRAVYRGDILAITRRDIGDVARAVDITGPDGKTTTLDLERRRAGVFAGTLRVTQPGLYRVADGTRIFMTAVGALNPVELSDVRATQNILAPAAAATGGAVRWLADGVPKLRRVAPGRAAAGQGWIGLVANGDFVVTGLTTFPLMPALLVLLLALGATCIAWWREGDAD